MKGKLLIIVLFAAVAGGIVWLSTRPQPSPSTAGTTPAEKTAGASPSVTRVTMLFGTEKRAFIDEAAAAFQKSHPQYQLDLTSVGSIEAADRILEMGDSKTLPMIFSPADSLILKMLASDWQTRHGGTLFDAEGDGAPQPMVITPLVFVAWEDRAQVLAKAGAGQITWKGLRRALTAAKGWAALPGGDASWGFVKLGHTDPTRSNSGLQAILSMALEHHGGKPLQVADLLLPDLQDFLRDIETGVTKFETSTGTFVTDMVRFGPSKYDIAVAYESLAIAQLENAQGRWGNLRVFYPSPTLWSDHPIALVKSDRLTAAEKEGALAWLRHLRSRAVQERALSFGFRPADPAIALKGKDPSNPFTRLAAYGLKIDIPPSAQTPEGPVVRNLLTLWTRLGLRAR